MMWPTDNRAQVATELALAVIIVIISAATAGIIMKSLFTQSQVGVSNQTNAVLHQTA